MKILVIPDIHETRHYKKYLDKINDFDKVIFLGDFFDYHGEEPEGDKYQNFLDICFFKKNHMDKVDLLIGNHDNSYLINDMTNSYQYANEAKIEKVLRDNIKLFKLAVEYDGYVFSHAGISKEFMEDRKLSSLDDLNNLMLSDELGYDYRDRSGYGDSKYASPTWIRPNSLLIHSAYTKQVVGHTALGEDIRFLQFRGNKVIFCDTYNHNKALFLDTSKEYEFEDVERKKEIKVEKIEIIQTRNGIYNVFVTYNKEFETKNLDAYSITGFKTPVEAEEAVAAMFEELYREGIDVGDYPKPEVIKYND